MTDKIDRYIELVYSKQSEIYKEEKDIVRRKELAARRVGVLGYWNQEWKDIFANKNKEVNKKIIAFCKSQHDLRHSALMVMYELFYRTLAELLNSTGEDIDTIKSKQAIIDGLESQIKEIEKTSNFVFSGDGELMFSVEDNPFTPEAMAEKYGE